MGNFHQSGLLFALASSSPLFRWIAPQLEHAVSCSSYRAIQLWTFKSRTFQISFPPSSSKLSLLLAHFLSCLLLRRSCSKGAANAASALSWPGERRATWKAHPCQHQAHISNLIQSLWSGADGADFFFFFSFSFFP
jgi:hypothetical protein